MESWYHHFFPTQPEPSSPPAPIYVSEETREVINQAKAAAAAAEADDQDVEAADEEFEGRRSPRGSPRTGDSAPPAHGISPDDEMEAATAVRPSRRQQVHPGASVDDTMMDRVGVLDDATARIMVGLSWSLSLSLFLSLSIRA